MDNEISKLQGSRVSKRSLVGDSEWLLVSEHDMSLENKKSIGLSVLLIMLGTVAMYEGLISLIVLVPVALFVWYEAKPVLRSGRN